MGSLILVAIPLPLIVEFGLIAILLLIAKDATDRQVVILGVCTIFVILCGFAMYFSPQRGGEYSDEAMGYIWWMIGINVAVIVVYGIALAATRIWVRRSVAPSS